MLARSTITSTERPNNHAPKTKVRKNLDTTQALWGTRVSAATISDLNLKIYGKINERRERPLVGEFPYVFLDGSWLKRSWGCEGKNVSVLVAIGVGETKSPAGATGS